MQASPELVIEHLPWPVAHRGRLKLARHLVELSTFLPLSLDC